MTAYSPGQAQFRLHFELSPITLVGGIAGRMPGGVLPIMALTDPARVGALTDGSAVDLDDAFATFVPLPGSSVIENQLGEYPFANLAVAANAIVKQPLMVSMLMRCPVKDAGGYAMKTAVMQALQNTLANHCALGGTFIVATPSYYYDNCLLVGVHDVSSGETRQAQVAWKWDFRRPLLSLDGAQTGSLNTFMRRLESGARVTGALTGRDLATPVTVGGPAIVPLSASARSAGIPAIEPS